MGMATLSLRVIGSVAFVVLARLLEPRDFGMVAMAMILFSATNLFSNLGMNTAIIYSQFDKSIVAFHGFVVSALSSTVIFILVFVNSTSIAEFLGDSEVAPFIRWLSVLILFKALVLIPEAVLRKELKFGLVGTSKVLSEFIYYTVAILLAFLGLGVWSLVYAHLVGTFTELLFLWLVSPIREWMIPRSWDWTVLKGMLSFGVKSTGSGFMSYFNTNWDDWLVGRLIGSTALGFYSKAYRFSNEAIVGFNRSVISGVLFPSYTKIQDDKKRLARAYLKSLAIVTLIMTPLSLGIFVIAQEFTIVLLGEKWIPMVPVLRIFAIMALFRPLSGSTSPLFQSVGRPDYNFHVGLVITAVMASLIFLLIRWEIVGVAIAVTVAYIVSFFFNIYQVNKFLPKAAAKMIPTIVPGLFAGTIMIAAVELSKPLIAQILGSQHSVISVIFLVAVGAVVYLTTIYLLQRRLIFETIEVFVSALRRRSRTSQTSEMEKS
jgi:PST family polysaccharide transporter